MAPFGGLIPGKLVGPCPKLNRKLDSDAITLLGATILQIIRETLDKVNAQAARLDPLVKACGVDALPLLNCIPVWRFRVLNRQCAKL